MKELSRKRKKQVSRGENCVRLHRSFTNISLPLCGVVYWAYDSACVERGSDPTVETKIYNWVTYLWFVFILHGSHCLTNSTRVYQAFMCETFIKLASPLKAYLIN